MNRRELFGMIGLGTGLAAAGIAGQITGLYLIDKSKHDKDISNQLEQKNAIQPSLQIMQTYENKKVDNHLNVGSNGHLYVKTNGEWKKIC